MTCVIFYIDKQNHDEPRLDWPTRLKIIQGVASGLGYLYNEFPRLTLPHGHLKSSNVFLDDDFNPLLAKYAFLPILKKQHAHVMMAYKSPDLIHYGRITKKTDVWCLGILILEIMTGLEPNYYTEDSDDLEDDRPKDTVTWVNSIRREDWSKEVFDKNMKWEKKNEIEKLDLLDIGLRCCESDMRMRWNMRKAIEKIQGLKESEEDEEHSHDANEVENAYEATEGDSL